MLSNNAWIQSSIWEMDSPTKTEFGNATLLFPLICYVSRAVSFYLSCNLGTSSFLPFSSPKIRLMYTGFTCFSIQPSLYYAHLTFHFSFSWINLQLLSTPLETTKFFPSLFPILNSYFVQVITFMSFFAQTFLSRSIYNWCSVVIPDLCFFFNF